MTTPNEHDTLPPEIDPALGAGICEPPTTIRGVFRRLGPGLIIAGSIVGSGELIATTKTGAQGGIALLWLIIIGCVIKVFVQVELGRYAITHGETTLAALDRVPGPRLKVNWIIWFWLVMIIITLGQQGGIVGGVGQALALTYPITGDYRDVVQEPSETELKRFIKWEDDLAGQRTLFSQLDADQQQRVLRGQTVLREKIAGLGAKGEQLLASVRNEEPLADIYTVDDKVWATLATVLTAWLLYWGRYRLIQNLSTVLVVTFTFITIGNVCALQSSAEFHIPLDDILRGLSFQLPHAIGDAKPVVTALAAFGIIGVGAAELIAYPYWCLEKGYAKFAGPRSDDEAWGRRAKGWLRVMTYDAFASMVVYTAATLAFFLMGVAVLHREGRDPDGMRMVSTLAAAYEPVFGDYAKLLFLVGAVAVLYSTFLVANAGHARMVTDTLKVYRLIDHNSQRTHDRSIAFFSVALPFICLLVFLTGANPVYLVLLTGMTQGLMLPILCLAALYFRFKATDPRLVPTRRWDLFFYISCLGMALTGLWSAATRLPALVEFFENLIR